MDLLFDLKESEGQTYVIVTHDARLAERADRIVEMIDGRFKEDLPEAHAPGADDPPSC